MIDRSPYGCAMPRGISVALRRPEMHWWAPNYVVRQVQRSSQVATACCSTIFFTARNVQKRLRCHTSRTIARKTSGNGMRAEKNETRTIESCAPIRPDDPYPMCAGAAHCVIPNKNHINVHQVQQPNHRLFEFQKHIIAATPSKYDSARPKKPQMAYGWVLFSLFRWFWWAVCVSEQCPRRTSPSDS